jgi:hypothetical protein
MERERKSEDQITDSETLKKFDEINKRERGAQERASTGRYKRSSEDPVTFEIIPSEDGIGRTKEKSEELKAWAESERSKNPTYWKRRKFKARWINIRYYKLINEGFTPEEANMIAIARLSSPKMRELRKQRMKLLDRSAHELSREKGAVSKQEVLEYTWNKIRDSDQEIVDWNAYRSLVYR